MSGINVELTILLDVLAQKEKLLCELLQATKHQEEFLKQESVNLDAFNDLIIYKQERIDHLMTIDEGFKLTYEKIRLQLEGNKDLYKEAITEMKEKIVAIGDLGVEIMVLEEKNKVQFILISNSDKAKMKDFRKSKKTVANYYSSMNNQKNAERSYFFDSKN